MPDTAVTVAGGWIALISLALGSFFTVVVSRYNLGETLFGRSRCPACMQQVRWHDLVPLISWIWLKGRCRSCVAPIGWFYPAVECAALAAGISAVAVFDGAELLVSLVMAWFLVLLAAFDARHFILPWALTVALAVIGIAAGIYGIGEAWDARVTGWIAGFLFMAGVRLGYRKWRGREGLGGGDVWLFAAAGAWVGWTSLPWVLLLAASGALILELVRQRGGIANADTKIPLGAWLAAALWLIYAGKAASL